MTWEKENGFKAGGVGRVFTECEAADLKGLWEREGRRKSRSQALAACINPEGNQKQGTRCGGAPARHVPGAQGRPGLAPCSAGTAGCSPQPR